MNNIKSQQGAALLILVLSIIFSGAIFLLSQNNSTSKHVSAENKTSASLAKAKEALIAYAVSYYLTDNTQLGHHGFLPCPEGSGSSAEGNSSFNCNGGARYVNHLGRLPWKTLEIPPLKDSAGECLWYAMSGSFSTKPRVQMLNDDTPGMIQVFNENASLYKGITPEDRAVAVIMAPGAPLSGQTRPAVIPGSNLPCKIAFDVVSAADYLDNYQGIDNAVVNDAPDWIDSFIHSTALNDNPSINDRIITVTAKEIFDAIKARAPMYTEKITELGKIIGNCLIDYATPSSACIDSCNADRNLCIAAGGAVSTCTHTRNACRKACSGKPPKTPKAPKTKPTGKPPGGGGSSFSQLPWPAPIDLKADYRDDNNYADLSNSSEGYFGRLPYTTTNSSSVDNIFTTCELKATYPEMFRLWQHWKDHWFYVLGSDFSPELSSAPANPCATDCPEFNGTRYAAILIFSDQRLNTQLRRTSEIEGSVPSNASKATLSNYLEGNNESNYPDKNFDNAYGVGSINDRHFCILKDMSIVEECL